MGQYGAWGVECGVVDSDGTATAIREARSKGKYILSYPDELMFFTFPIYHNASFFCSLSTLY